MSVFVDEMVGRSTRNSGRSQILAHFFGCSKFLHKDNWVSPLQLRKDVRKHDDRTSLDVVKNSDSSIKMSKYWVLVQYGLPIVYQNCLSDETLYHFSSFPVCAIIFKVCLPRYLLYAFFWCMTFTPSDLPSQDDRRPWIVPYYPCIRRHPF